MRKRKAKFNPEDSRDLPVRAEELKEERRTILQFVDNRPAVEEEDVWKGRASRKKSGAEWKGCTVFCLLQVEQEDEDSKEARTFLSLGNSVKSICPQSRYTLTASRYLGSCIGSPLGITLLEASSGTSKSIDGPATSGNELADSVLLDISSSPSGSSLV